MASAKQRRFVNAIAHDPKFAAKAGVSLPSVREFPDQGLQTLGGAVRAGTYLRKKK